MWRIEMVPAGQVLPAGARMAFAHRGMASELVCGSWIRDHPTDPGDRHGFGKGTKYSLAVWAVVWDDVANVWGEVAP